MVVRTVEWWVEKSVEWMGELSADKLVVKMVQ
jgi:hypothetical protein